MSKRSHVIRVAAVMWMAVIFGLSSLPGSAVPGRFGTLGHIVVYSVLGGLYFLALDASATKPRAAVFAVILASLYGITDEFHQSFVPGRYPDVGDWVVDTLSAAAAALAVLAIGRRLSRSRTTRPDRQ